MSGSAELSPELRAFLYTCIDAVEQIELLVRLQRSEAAWTARTAADEIGVSDSVARRHLEILAARGLLQITAGKDLAYRFAPKTPELQRYAAQLVTAYATARSQLMQFVTSRPRQSMKTFSDAFKLRKTD